MRVYLVPKYTLDIDISIDATVEAEYGSEIIEGKTITLAHHVSKYKDHRAPCIQEVSKLPDSSNIIISHIDLDTLGGIAALMGVKHENKEFWEGVEYIDLNGPHHLNELDNNIANMINAYNAYAALKHLDKFDDIKDVTDVVIDRINIINRIIDGDEKLITEGLDYFNREQKRIEECLVFENPNIRIFYSNGIFCNASYYSKKLDMIVPYIVSFNSYYDSLSFSSENGGIDISCQLVMKELFGKEAGGHNGIAGSPRNQKMTHDDFVKLSNYVNDLVNKMNKTNYKLEMDICLKQEIKK